MRRISLALALIGAAAATGCGQTSTSNTGGDRGVAEGTFNVTVQNGQNGNTALAITGGYVVSTPAGIDCGIAPHTACSADFAVETAPGVLNVVTLVATATDPSVAAFFGFAGDCKGIACELSGAADKYVLAQFARAGSGGTGHPIEWGNPWMHVPMYLSDAFNCQGCHGADLMGGLTAAPSCASCHAWPFGNGAIVDSFAATNPFTPATAWNDVIGGHFRAEGHNSGACGRCHAGAGFKDYIGADGTADNHLAGFVTNVENAAALDNATLASGFSCTMCHNAVTFLGGGSLNTVRFAQATGQGVTLTVDTTTAICGQCHTTQRDGRNVATLGKVIGAPADWDAQLATLNATVRPHYLGAASTFLGEEAGVYGQVSGASYTGRNEHGGLTACTTCHDPHTGALLADAEVTARCGSCHEDELTGLPVATFAQLEESRQFGFEGDIDGDAVAEPLSAELSGLRAKLATAVQTYASQVTGTTICFQPNPNGLVDDARILQNPAVACGTAPNNVGFNKYTARLLRAVFNYIAVSNDPGAWAHNPRYAIEILYDSIADLNQGLVLKGFTPVANGKRAFAGHFGAVEDPSPYAAMLYHGGAQAGMPDLLPPMGFTSGACYQCHGGKGGMDAYLASNQVALTAAVITAANKVTALQCSTCHALDGADMKGLRTVASVTFPPQKGNPPAAAQNVVTFAAADLPNSFAVCGTCHSGRENSSSIDIKISTGTQWAMGTTNPHYLGAAGMILGNDAKVMYQYTGQTYAGKTVFWKTGTNGNAPGPYGSPHGAECTGCHKPKASKHEFGVDLAYCATCHTGQYALAPVEEEVNAAEAQLLAAIKAYATANAASTTVEGICYNGLANPYWFVTVGGVCQDGVANAPAASVAFAKCDSKLLKATFNYQWTQKDPGAFAHNEVYVMQAIYDSIVDLGGTPAFTRP